MFTNTADELDAGMEAQDMSMLLQSSRDVFTSMAGFNLGQGRFRIRGYSSENMQVLINQIPVNDPETGWASWSNWGGLNDVTRFVENRSGISANPYAFGLVGGYSHIQTRASAFGKSTKFSYALSNRVYTHRMMLTHTTGMQENGWAFAVSASRRWSEEGYVPGTWMDAGAYFISAEKKLNEKHHINMLVFGAPITQARQGIAVEEAYTLSGSNYYNPLWGYQEGKKRSARISNTHQPTGMLTHYFRINENSTLHTSLSYSFGRSGITGLNWYDAKDPRPDYYRYLPSYFKNDSLLFSQQTNKWQQNEELRQLNWDEMYQANYNNLFIVYDANGVSGNHVEGKRAKYIIEEMRSDRKNFSYNTRFEHQLNEKLSLVSGLSGHLFSVRNFKVLHDLLGADFWIDIDRVAEMQGGDETNIQNDLSTPNKIIQEGDVFGYDYTTHIQKADLFTQLGYNIGKIESHIALSLSNTTFWREGHLQNGRFPDNSAGHSSKQTFLNYGIKSGLAYKLTGRHIVTLHVLYQTRAPFARNAYLAPRVRDAVVNGLTDEIIQGGDVNYILRFPKIKARLSGYYTEIKNSVWARNFYHDTYQSFVNYTMSGVNTLYTGTELGIEATVFSSFSLQGVFSAGQYLYNSRPLATITRDNAADVIGQNRLVYLKNYRIGGMPQTASSVGIKYNSPRYWFVGFSANYFADIYLDPNPDRRTEEALEKFVSSDPQWDALLQQTKLENGITADMYAGKSWRLRKKYFLNLNITLSNVLNNQQLITGGFEQLRYDADDVNRFPSKLSYMFGRTFFTMLSIRF